MKRRKNIFNGKLRDSEDEQKGNVFHKNNKVERSCYAKKSNTKKEGNSQNEDKDTQRTSKQE